VASIRAIEFLASTNQRESENGAWYGRWGVNYVYGTSNVLCRLEYFVKCPLGCVDGGSRFGVDYESLCPKENCTERLDYPARLARSLVSPESPFSNPVKIPMAAGANPSTHTVTPRSREKAAQGRHKQLGRLFSLSTTRR
jgi:hypothetical protein